MIGDRQCGYRVFSSESSRSCCPKKLRSHESCPSFFPRPFTGQPARLGSTRLARGWERAFDRLSKNSLLRLTVPSANFLLPSTCSRFTRPLSGSQFSHGCPRRDRACVMSECTRHEVEFRVFFERWMERSLLENWPFRKLPATSRVASSLFRSSLVLVSARHRITLSILHSQLVVDSFTNWWSIQRDNSRFF